MTVAQTQRISSRGETAAPDLVIESHTGDDSFNIKLKNQWRHLEALAQDPFASLHWVSAWYRSLKDHPSKKPVVLAGTFPTKDIAFILPLVHESHATYSVLTCPSGNHAPYYAGLFSPKIRKSINPSNAIQFWKTVYAAAPDADALVVNGLPGYEIEQDNPLAHLPHFQDGEGSQRLLLSADWDQLYKSKINAKSRGNDRRCERRLAENGRVEFEVAKTQAQRNEVLNTLIAQKSAWLEELGAPNFFNDPNILSFYKSLIKNCEDEDKHPVHLSALKFKDTPIAINLGLQSERGFYGLILSNDQGPTMRFGPGRMLLRRSMEHLCHQGIAYFDFGVGADTNKEYWSDQVITRHNIIAPITAKGRLVATVLRKGLKTKDFLKQSPLLWETFLKYRRFLGV